MKKKTYLEKSNLHWTFDYMSTNFFCKHVGLNISKKKKFVKEGKNQQVIRLFIVGIPQ